MREYNDTTKNRLSFIIDPNEDNHESFSKSKLLIETKFPQLQVLEFNPPFWEHGNFVFKIDEIRIELFFTSYFGGTEINIDNSYSEGTKDKVRLLALEIYNFIHNIKSPT